MTAMETHLGAITGPALTRGEPPAAAHEHAWAVTSRHAVSTGWVLYVRCAGCRALRVDHQAHLETPPAALSAEVAAQRGARKA